MTYAFPIVLLGPFARSGIVHRDGQGGCNGHATGKITLNAQENPRQRRPFSALFAKKAGQTPRQRRQIHGARARCSLFNNHSARFSLFSRQRALEAGK